MARHVRAMTTVRMNVRVSVVAFRGDGAACPRDDDPLADP